MVTWHLMNFQAPSRELLPPQIAIRFIRGYAQPVLGCKKNGPAVVGPRRIVTQRNSICLGNCQNIIELGFAHVGDIACLHSEIQQCRDLTLTFGGFQLSPMFLQRRKKDAQYDRLLAKPVRNTAVAEQAVIPVACVLFILVKRFGIEQPNYCYLVTSIVQLAGHFPSNATAHRQPGELIRASRLNALDSLYVFPRHLRNAQVRSCFTIQTPRLQAEERLLRAKCLSKRRI
nr:hypothetical protein [Mesorhizobium caraganae]